ncbi:MAG: NPXTG-anchored protein [Hydrogenoanaerobacterium sp.]
MKKIIAMLLALTTAAGLAVTAFAEAVPANTQTIQSKASIIFDKDINGVDINSGALLTSGKTYYFPVKYIADGKTAEEAVALTAAQYNSFRFRFTNEDGKQAVESIKIEKYKSLYSLAVKTKGGYPTALTDVAYTTTVIDTKNDSAEITAPSVAFAVGYKAIDESNIKNHEYVAVDSSAPVVTKEAFEALNEMAGGKEVNFVNGVWEYSVRVNGMKDVNMLSNSDEIDEVIKKYERNEFKFVSFPAAPEFRTTGTLSIDVSSDMDMFEGKFFAYKYVGGKLVKLDSELNSDDEVLKLKTKELGRFVLTNKEIKWTTVIEPDGSIIIDNGISGGTTGGNTGTDTDGTQPNPDTGANSFVALAAAMALIAAAGVAVSRKRK